MVTDLLTEYPKLRDSDTDLSVSVLHREFNQLGFHGLSHIVSFFRLYSQGKLTTAETIARTSRKIQASNPELRGENWGKRKKKSIEVAKIINL